jgi:biopolymer transport protein TolR
VAISFAKNRGGKRRAMMSEINVTPMVDVMLVLLIIFMVTAPLLTSGITLDLPKGDGKVIEGSDKSLDIGIDAKGRIFIADTEYKKQDVIPKVKSIIASNPAMQIIISADKKSAYGDVVELMAMLRAEGIMKVGLKTDPKESFKKGSGVR